MPDEPNTGAIGRFEKPGVAGAVVQHAERTVDPFDFAIRELAGSPSISCRDSRDSKVSGRRDLDMTGSPFQEAKKSKLTVHPGPVAITLPVT